MNKNSDVAIVGGGAIGCSIAYELSKRGIECTVFEKERLASGASGATAGMIGPIWYIDHKIEPYFDLGMRSYYMFPSLVEELKEVGIDPEYQQTGAVKILFDEQDDSYLLDDFQWQKELGIGVRWLDREELVEREPKISDQALGAVLSPADASVRGTAYVNGLALAASRLGAMVYEETDIYGLEFDGDRVIGVKTKWGIHYADQTIITAGAWSGLTGYWGEEIIPVRPIKGQRILLRKPDFLPKSWIQSLVPQRDGTILSAATREEGNFDNVVTGEAIAQMVESAKQVFPLLADAEFVSASAGVRPGTPDGMPIMGPLTGLRGVSVATGHDHVGIMCSPYTATLMADYITTADQTELLPFSISRFK